MNNAFPSARQLAALLSILTLSWSVDSPGLAIEPPGAVSRQAISPIASWGMTNTLPGPSQEEAIWKWMQERPKSDSELKTFHDLVDALQRSRPENPSFEIALDTESLKDELLSLDSPLTCGPVAIGRNLLQVTRDNGLSFRIADNVVTFNAVAWADLAPVTRVDDVTPLVSSRELEGKYQFEFEDLRKVLKECVQPDCWVEMGGVSTLQPIVINRHCLFVINSTYDIHFEIQSSLDTLAIAGRVLKD